MSGTYSIIERLAVGGMGEVFLARQSGMGGFARPVVLKRLLPEIDGDDEAVSRLLDEARVVGSLQHENVVGIIEVGERDGHPFLALEYVHGENAGALLRRAVKASTPLSTLAIARIVRDAARGLHAAHCARGENGRLLAVVHRDVAPKNIFVRTDGVSKIGDFGIAKMERKLSATATGAVPGTLSYMSPEQTGGEDVTPKSDQFSLGIVLWELLTGVRLFKAPSPSATIDAIARRRLRKPSRMNRQALPLDAVCLRMLERDVSKRFADLAEVVSAIDAAVPDAGGDAGQAAVATEIERLAGEDLRKRQGAIETGVPAGVPAVGMWAMAPIADPTVALNPTRFDRPSQPRDRQSHGAHTPLTARFMRTLSRLPMVLAERLGGIRTTAAAVVVCALLVGMGAAAARVARGPSDLQRTRVFIDRAVLQRPLINAEALIAMSTLDGVDADTAKRAVAVTTPLVQERLQALRAHYALDDDERLAAESALHQALRGYEDRARAALLPLGAERLSKLLDSWAYDASAPEEWMEAPSAADLQQMLRDGGLAFLQSQAPVRQRTVEGMLARVNAPSSVRGLVFGIAQQRDQALATLTTAAVADLETTRARVDALERQGTAQLVAQLGQVHGEAVAAVAFVYVPRAHEPEPMFGSLPSSREEREQGQGVAEH